MCWMTLCKLNHRSSGSVDSWVDFGLNRCDSCVAMLMNGSSASKSGLIPRNIELFEALAEIPLARARDWSVPCPRGEKLSRLMMITDFPSIFTTNAEETGDLYAAIRLKASDSGSYWWAAELATCASHARGTCFSCRWLAKPAKRGRRAGRSTSGPTPRLRSACVATISIR
jgi:hypothetical protein